MELVDELSLFLPEGTVKAASAGPGAPGGGTSGFTRDADLFLTREQMTAMIPILTDLAGSKRITTEAVEHARKGIDALLSDAQKDEYEALLSSRESGKRGTGPEGGGMGSGGPGAPGGGPGGAPGGAGGPGAGPGGQEPPNESALLKSLVDALHALLEETDAQ